MNHTSLTLAAVITAGLIGFTGLPTANAMSMHEHHHHMHFLHHHYQHYSCMYRYRHHGTYVYRNDCRLMRHHHVQYGYMGY